jgi:hypothetical protein
MVPSHLLTIYNGGIPGDCSKLLSFQNIKRRYATGGMLPATPPLVCHLRGTAGPFLLIVNRPSFGSAGGQVIAKPCALTPATVSRGRPRPFSSRLWSPPHTQSAENSQNFYASHGEAQRKRHSADSKLKVKPGEGAAIISNHGGHPGASRGCGHN